MLLSRGSAWHFGEVGGFIGRSTCCFDGVGVTVSVELMQPIYLDSNGTNYHSSTIVIGKSLFPMMGILDSFSLLLNLFRIVGVPHTLYSGYFFNFVLQFYLHEKLSIFDVDIERVFIFANEPTNPIKLTVEVTVVVHDNSLRTYTYSSPIEKIMFLYLFHNRHIKADTLRSIWISSFFLIYFPNTFLEIRYSFLGCTSE